MKLEKNRANIKCLIDRDLRFRVKSLDQKRSGIWVSLKGKNLCFPMLMHDFLDWCEQEVQISLDVDRSWNNHRGFVVHTGQEYWILPQMKRFIEERNIMPEKNSDIFSDYEWYVEA